MKKALVILVILILLSVSLYSVGTISIAKETTKAPVVIDTSKSRIEISFDYKSQSGFASNQFAVWIADNQGKLVKTLFVTDFTARKGGWEYRKQSLPKWVADSDIANLTPQQIYLVSGATPSSQTLTYVWYGDNAENKTITPGIYTVFVEATLRGENAVIYQTKIDLTGDSSENKPTGEFSGNSTAERDMVTNVTVRWIKK